MSHGEQWVVPFNLFMIVFTVVVWAISLPLWTTLVIALPIALLLGYFARDKYGGMQIVLLLNVGWLMGTLALGAKYRDAVESQTDLRVGRLILQFVGTIVLGALALFLCLAVLTALAIACQWMLGKFGFGPCAKGTPEAGDASRDVSQAPKSADGPDAS